MSPENLELLKRSAADMNAYYEEFKDRRPGAKRWTWRDAAGACFDEGLTDLEMRLLAEEGPQPEEQEA